MIPVGFFLLTALPKHVIMMFLPKFGYQHLNSTVISVFVIPGEATGSDQRGTLGDNSEETFGNQ
jgi:hypothetical protein